MHAVFAVFCSPGKPDGVGPLSRFSPPKPSPGQEEWENKPQTTNKTYGSDEERTRKIRSESSLYVSRAVWLIKHGYVALRAERSTPAATRPPFGRGVPRYKTRTMHNHIITVVYPTSRTKRQKTPTLLCGYTRETMN